MGLFSFLFGSKPRGGPIYSMASVKEQYRRIAEDAFAEDRYTIEVKNGPDVFAARLHTNPPLRATVKMDRSLGEPAAMIITGVYEI